MTTLGIFLKHPLPGAVKTRLGGEIGNELAAELYKSFQADILERTVEIADQRVLAYAPDSDTSHEYFTNLRRADDLLWPQPECDLGERMSQFIQNHITDGPVVIIGSDSPNIPVLEIQNAFLHLQQKKIVLGPAVDGGYYLVGQSQHCPEIFEQIDWSTTEVLAQTIQKIRDHNFSLHLLSVWYDIDTLEDLKLLFSHMQAMEAASQDSDLPNQTYELLKTHLLG